MKQFRVFRASTKFLQKKRSVLHDLLQSADSYRDTQQWDLAGRQYQRALKIKPAMAGIWVQLGHALKEAGRIDAALNAYRRSITIESSNADTYLQLGHAFKLQGRTLEAMASYAKALALDPDLKHAADELSQLTQAKAADPACAAGMALYRVPIDGADEHSAQWMDDRLARANLLPDFLPHFDAAYYAQQQDIEAEFGRTGPIACVTHFFETGLAACAPISERLWFDSAFYRQTYNIAFPMTDTDAYRHWLNTGLSQGHAPNEMVWLQDVLGINLQSFDQIDLDYCRAAAPELWSSTNTEILQWLVEGGVLDDRLDGFAGPSVFALLQAASLRASARGNTKLALALMQLILVRNPDYEPILQVYADRLVDEEQFFAATAVYRGIVKAGMANLWTHTHLMVCLSKQRRFREAYEAIADGVQAFPDHITNRYNMDDALDCYFDASVKNYNVLARAGRISDGQALITEFCDVVTSSGNFPRLPGGLVRSVALFALMDLPQCKFYRVDQKVEQLESAGFYVKAYNANNELAQFLAEIRQFDAVIFYRLAPLRTVLTAIKAASRLGLITFYEIDDLLFLAKEYPGTLESYAGQITRETFNMLAMGVPLFLSVMKMCDYAIASTPSLAREMAPFVTTGRAFVHRNGMGLDHSRYLDYMPLARAADGPVTIFYGSGTRAHKEDFQQLIEPALIEIARRHGKAVAFVMIGWLPISDAFRAASSSLTVIEPIFDLHQYWSLLRVADINLAVLKPSLNVDCKSEIKWMEAALFGVPSVVSRTATYAEVIEDGRTGFLCDTIADWVTTLDRLVCDSALRSKVGLAAQTVVRRDYNIEVLGENLRSIMEAVSPVLRPTRQKILVVNVFYAPQTYGGATRVMHDNIIHLSQHHPKEFEFEVFTSVDGGREDYVVESYAQDGIAVTGVTRSVAGETMAELADAKMEVIFRKHLTVTQPDLIHFHCIQRLSIAVVNVAKELGIPYVITAHDAWWVSDNQFLIDAHGREWTYDYAHPMQVLIKQGQKSFARMQGLRSTLMSAKAVLGVSEPFSALYRRCGVPNVQTVANGVSLLPPCPRTISPDGRVRLGHVGGMARHKGFLMLKHVLLNGHFEHLRLIVVNHSKSKNYEHQEIWGTTPVTVIGKVGQGEVSGLYAGIDVLLAPSLWAESFGLVTREAHASGCWVVASDRGAIGIDVLEGVDGHVIDVSDSQALSAILTRIDHDRARYLNSPPVRTLRSAAEQGDELADLYRSLRHA